MEVKQLLGKNIQKYRKLNKMTQENLSENVGIEINSISAIETGKSFPSPENLEKIAAALNVSMSNLFAFDEKTDNANYLKEINSNLKLMKNNSAKLALVNDLIRKILFSL